jgi:beta-galactosidase
VTNAEDDRRRALPFLLCEYAHAMGNGPGSLVDYQRILEGSDRFCGAFVWEWIDHGFRSTTADGVEFFMHGGDVDFRPNGGRYCLDGLVFPDRTPSPGLAELAAAIAPITLEPDPAAGFVRIHNKHDSRDLSHVAVEWVLEHNGVGIDRGTLTVPSVAARTAVEVALPDLVSPSEPGPGETWLTVSAVLATATPWAKAGHEIAFGQALVGIHPADRSSPAPPAAATTTQPARRSTARGSGDVELGPAVFDGRTGRLVRLGSLPLDGPALDVWRAPVENDRGQGPRNTMAATWKAVGLDRMMHRTDSVDRSGDTVVVSTRTAPAAHGIALRTVFTWTLTGDGVELQVDVTPEGIWRATPIGNHDVWLPRLGLRLALPGSLDRAEWFGRGPGETYSDSLAASRVGRFSSTVDALQTDYPVPEENGNHVGTRWLRVTGPGTPGLAVGGLPHFDFTLRRWTSEHLESARHPHDLRDSGRVWLNVDHAQQGLGSAACGPAIPDRYRVEPEPTRFGVRFAIGD